jgi:type IX secretion system PorP/SprF family membrane protein
MRLFTLFAKGTLLLAVIFSVGKLSAQDLHFSQYYSQVSTLNPGLVGNYDGSFRVSAIYRNQWTSAVGSAGYQTVGADADFSLLEGYLQNSKLALGVGFFNDHSGTAGYTNTSASLTLAYHQGFGKEGKHRLSLGLQGGFMQTTIANPVFGDQFSGFNQTTPLNSSAEIYKNGTYKFDFNAGLYWKSNFNDKVKLGVGFAAYHLITPSQSLVTSQITGDLSTTAVLPRRFDADLSLEGIINKHWSITPEILFMNQQPFNEILPGILATYYFNTGFRNNNSFSLGIRYREGGTSTPDAIIPMANVEFRNVRLGFSYDANVSSLSTSTTNRGAFELSLSYIGESIRSYKANKSLPANRF